MHLPNQRRKMRREDQWSIRRYRTPPGPVPTLGQLQCGAGKWVWAICEWPGDDPCMHRSPLALAPFVIRWGTDTSSDSCKPAYNPFVSHAFFAAAEASGSACPRTGWGPRHLLARLDGEIAGIVPCYLKSHSQG